MSQMHVPVTDAFDDSTALQSLEVKLTPRQIEWLKQKADERSLSLDHVLRALITKQIRNSNAPSPSSGDRNPSAPASDDTPPRRHAAATPDEDDAPASIVESLRSASERLQDLTDGDDESSGSDLSNTLARLKTRREASDSDAPETEGDDAVVLDDSGPSMFDLVEE